MNLECKVYFSQHIKVRIRVNPRKKRYFITPKNCFKCLYKTNGIKSFLMFLRVKNWTSKRGEAVKSFTFKECLFLIPVSTLFLKFLNGRVKFYKLRQGRGWGDIFSQSLIVINWNGWCFELEFTRLPSPLLQNPVLL